VIQGVTVSKPPTFAALAATFPQSLRKPAGFFFSSKKRRYSERANQHYEPRSEISEEDIGIFGSYFI
jgi:hypothetical protein